MDQRYEKMRINGQKRADLGKRAYTRLAVALVMLPKLGIAGFRHSTRALALSKKSPGIQVRVRAGPGSVQHWKLLVSTLAPSFTLNVPRPFHPGSGTLNTFFDYRKSTLLDALYLLEALASGWKARRMGPDTYVGTCHICMCYFGPAFGSPNWLHRRHLNLVQARDVA